MAVTAAPESVCTLRPRLGVQATTNASTPNDLQCINECRDGSTGSQLAAERERAWQKPFVSARAYDDAR
jgi:hypothetical protein